MDRCRKPGKIASHRSHNAIEGTASRLLTELARRKAKNVTLNHDAAHVLITSTHTGGWRAAVDHAIDPCHAVLSSLRIFPNNRPLCRPEPATASTQHGQVVSVCDVRAESKVATMQSLTNLSSGSVRDSPIRVELIAEACIRNESIEGRRAFRDRTAGLQEDGDAIIPADILEHTRR